ncbi:MAG TPA: hypothetical protein VFE03_04215 [Caulobacteraceae bacterium]|jgi:flagellar biosynthesis/type III secretory pathway protein FliH|nr:hypothetical protein [Caulobacteraceae bacterium]
MNAVIKAVHATAPGASVRPLRDGGLTAGIHQPASEPSTRLQATVAELANAVRERDAALEALRQQVEAARREGEARGRLAGRKEAQDQAAQNLARLEKGLEKALQAFSYDRAAMERLAAALAREGLSRVFGDAAHYTDMVTSIIRHQAEQLDAAAVVCVQVSRHDFQDASGLEPLVASLAPSALQITIEDHLAAGECRIKLRLGELDVGVGQQWHALDDLLTELSQGEGGE